MAQRSSRSSPRPLPRLGMSTSLALSYRERTDVVSWGRVVRQPQLVASPRFADEVPALLRDTRSKTKLAVGLRRSYGDSCLNSAGALIDMRALDRFVAFDPVSGRLRAQAGTTLSEILRIAAPKGWFLPTTPGTRFVTLGGAIANDVHGKNHHRVGSMGHHVVALDLLRGDGERLTINSEAFPEMFGATIGGLGLTGIIEWAELQLVKIGGAYLDVEIIPYDNLDAFWALARESAERFEHTVAWVDSMAQGGSAGRGLFSRANWSTDRVYSAHSDNTWRSIPMDLPGIALNRLSVSAFNALYFRLNAVKTGVHRQHYAPFFYPLDVILNWNRLYGRRGMLQYQCVVPFGPHREAIRALFEEIARSGQASFLAVLKTLGDIPSLGLLSFPRHGVTLALDFPNRGVETLRVMDRLDAIIREAGGAIYPAKDGRMSAETFRASFPRWDEFAKLKDPNMNSDFWRRVAQ
jgi:FAD/FMN-containing dehydrogenase